MSSSVIGVTVDCRGALLVTGVSYFHYGTRMVIGRIAKSRRELTQDDHLSPD
jgi:hypothetical protein